MSRLIKHKQRLHIELLGLLLFYSLVGLIVCYSAYSMVRDSLAIIERENTLCQAKMSLEQHKQEKQRLAHRISLLSDDSLDRDLLEERVRAVLSYSHQDDQIILLLFRLLLTLSIGESEQPASHATSHVSDFSVSHVLDFVLLIFASFSGDYPCIDS